MNDQYISAISLEKRPENKQPEVKIDPVAFEMSVSRKNTVSLALQALATTRQTFAQPTNNYTVDTKPANQTFAQPETNVTTAIKPEAVNVTPVPEQAVNEVITPTNEQPAYDRHSAIEQARKLAEAA